MKDIIKKIRIYPISLILFGFLFLWHYTFVYDGAYNSGDDWLLRAYRWLGAALLLVLLLSIACLQWYRSPSDEPGGWIAKIRRIFTLTLEKTFFFTVLSFGLLYVFVLPPLSAPDEISHYISAYQLSNTLLGQPSNADSGHVLIRSEDLAIEDVEKEYRLTENHAGNRVVFSKSNKEEPSVVLSQTLDEADYDYIYNHFHYLDDGQNDLAISEFPPVRTVPIPYLASALGISLARVMNLGSIYLLFFGRLFNLAAIVILMTIAIRILPLYKEILFGVCLLPMSLHLAASYSYDGFIFAMYALFFAYILHLRFTANTVKIRDLVCITLLLVLVSPCKMVYAPLALLAFLVPKEKFGSRKFYIASIVIVAMAVILSILLTNFFLIRLYTTETTNLAWAGAESVSPGYIFHNPIAILKMIYNTFIHQLGFYHFGMIGQYLGNLDAVLDISYFAVILFTICLIALGLSRNDEEIRLFAPQKWLIVFAVVLCIGLIALSMLLAWTPVGSNMIQGIQGRYFLPLLPMSLILLKQKGLVFTFPKNRAALILMCLTNAFVLLRIFSIVSIRL